MLNSCQACTRFGVPDVQIQDPVVISLGPGGWFTKRMSGNKLIGITVYYNTSSPSTTGYYQAKYRAHWLGSNPAWWKYEYDDDDAGAGNDWDQLDMIELTISPL